MPSTHLLIQTQSQVTLMYQFQADYLLRVQLMERVMLLEATKMVTITSYTGV